MLKLIAGTLGTLFLYAAYKLVTADGTQTVAPPDKSTLALGVYLIGVIVFAWANASVEEDMHHIMVHAPARVAELAAWATTALACAATLLWPMGFAVVIVWTWIHGRMARETHARMAIGRSRCREVPLAQAVCCAPVGRYAPPVACAFEAPPMNAILAMFDGADEPAFRAFLVKHDMLTMFDELRGGRCRTPARTVRLARPHGHLYHGNSLRS